MATIDEQVDASNCDAWEAESPGTMYLTDTRVYMTSATTPTSRSWGGLRFVGENLPPQGAIIVAAYIELNIETTALDDAYGKLHFELAAAPAVFTTSAGNITSRPRTTAYASWVANL